VCCKPCAEQAIIKDETVRCAQCATPLRMGAWVVATQRPLPIELSASSMASLCMACSAKQEAQW
jgi:hypothetical protein